MPVLECNNFVMDFLGGDLSIPSFDLDEGEIVVINGDSSARVSELLLYLGGLIDKQTIFTPAPKNSLVCEQLEFPASELDKLLLCGKPLYSMSNFDRAKQVGYVFNNPEIAIFGRSVEEEYLHSLTSSGVEPDRTYIATRLFRYGLGDRLSRKTSLLSGGEMQRLNCACALDRSPKLIVADFTTTNLDEDFLKDFCQWVAELCDSGSAAILGIDHRALPIQATRVIIAKDGVLGTPGLVQETAPSPSLAERLNLREQEADFALDVQGLCRYGVTAPVSFTVKRNSVHVLKGPNGSGKTTIAQFVVGRSRKRRDDGEFELGEGCRPALATQFPERTFLELTVQKELPDEDLRRLIGISKDMDGREPRSLNRSERKLLSIATAIYYSEGLTILDEPTCGMDAAAKERFAALINSYSSGMAFLIITHDPEFMNLRPCTDMEGETA